MNADDSTTMSLSTREQFFAAYLHKFFDLPDPVAYFIALLVLCFLSWFTYCRGSKMKATDSTIISLSTREQFFAAYRRQLFDLPDSMIYYIAKNPKSSQVYQKMIQSCKYFYIKNQMLVLHCLKIDDNGWKTCCNQSECRAEYLTKKVNINMESLSGCKLWIQYGLRIDSTNPRCACDLIPHIYQCDADFLRMGDQKLSLQQFLFLSRNVKYTFLTKVVMNSNVGAEVPLEDIVASLPYLQLIIFKYSPESKNVSSATVKKLVQIPHFKYIGIFKLCNINEEFDIETFFDYYKKMEPKFHFCLHYGDNFLLEEYAAKLEEFITYVLGYPDQKPPLIVFPDQDDTNAGALLELHKKFPVF